MIKMLAGPRTNLLSVVIWVKSIEKEKYMLRLLVPINMYHTNFIVACNFCPLKSHGDILGLFLFLFLFFVADVVHWSSFDRFYFDDVFVSWSMWKSAVFCLMRSHIAKMIVGSNLQERCSKLIHGTHWCREHINVYFWCGSLMSRRNSSCISRC